MKARVKVKRVDKKASEGGKKEKVQVLRVKAGQKYRGAREAWYARLKEYDGKPLDDFLASTKEKMPSLPESGKAENPMGWVRFFQRVGVLGIVAEK